MQKIREAFLNSNPESKIKAYTVIAVFLLSITGLIFILSKYIDLSKFSYSKNDPVSNGSDNNVNVSELIDIDSYTSIKKSNGDSNGNGVENWREVAAGLDPAQNNDIASYNFSTSTEDKVPDYSSNFTDLVSRDLYVAEQYKNQNQNIDMNAINTQLLKKLSDMLNPPKVQILKLVDKSNSAEYKIYFNDMAKLLNYMLTSDQVELQELASSSEANLYDFKKTRDYASNLNAACEEYKLISVPKEYSELHIATVFECDKYVVLMLAFMTTEKDPVKSQIAFSQYEKSLLTRIALLKLYSEKVKSLNIAYTSKEAGSVYYLVK